MKPILITILIAFNYCSCSSQDSQVKNLNPDQFEIGFSRPNAQLVDVRTEEEFGAGHLSKAKNINYDGDDFEKKMNGLNKKNPVYLYCKMGGRSIKAGDWAVKNGFSEVYNLEEGITAWTAANKPVVIEKSAARIEGMTFDDYLSQIKKSDKLVLVDFNAVWCGPCKMLKPSVVKTAKTYADKLELLDIDVDRNPLVARSMNIQGIPLLVLYKNGKEVWRNMGLLEEKELVAKVKQFLK